MNNKIDLICSDLIKADRYFFLLVLDYFVILVGLWRVLIVIYFENLKTSTIEIIKKHNILI